MGMSFFLASSSSSILALRSTPAEEMSTTYTPCVVRSAETGGRCPAPAITLNPPLWLPLTTNAGSAHHISLPCNKWAVPNMDSF